MAGLSPLPNFRANPLASADPDYVGSIPPSWQEDAARAHALLSRASVEVGLESQGNRDLVAFQLAQAIGPNLTVPDLSGQGLRFVRAQLLRSGDEPLAQLLYLGTSGAPLALYAKKSEETVRAVVQALRRAWRRGVVAGRHRLSPRRRG